MLKLPSIRGQADSEAAPGAIPSEESLRLSRNQHPGSQAVTVHGWQELASELARTSSLPKFRSAALYCEVKLLEALRKYSEADVKRPDRYRVAICTNLLSELSDISGAFNRVLARIRDEIVLAIYSDYYSTKSGADRAEGVVVEQTPYFMVVENLENEINTMKLERSEWIEKFRAREEDIQSIEERVESLVRSLEAHKARGEATAAKLAVTDNKLAEAREELRLERLESDRLRGELVQEREESERLRSSGKTLAAGAAKEMDAMKARLKRAEVERQLAGAAAEMAMHASHDMVPKGDLESAMAQVERYKEQVEQLRGLGGAAVGHRPGDGRLDGEGGASAQEGADVVVGGAADQRTEPNRPLTPRPAWEDVKNGELATGSTAEAVSRMDATISGYKSAVAEYKRALEGQMTEEERRLHMCLLEPEPDVAAQSLEFHSLLTQFDHTSSPSQQQQRGHRPGGGGIDAPSSSTSSSGAHEGLLPIETFGTGPEVPRYLRFAGRIASRQMQKRDLEALVQEIWSAKSQFDAQRRSPSQLSDFLYFFLRDKYGGSQEEISTVGYNMQLMLQAHAYDADVELFLKVLNGEVSEEVRFDRERMVRSLHRAFLASDTQGAGRLPKSLVLELLKRFFPNKAAINLKELLDTLKEAEETVVDPVTGDRGAFTIVYGPLFSSDSEMNDTPFLEAVKDQHLAEINEYVSGMEATLFALEDEAVERRMSQRKEAPSASGDQPSSPISPHQEAEEIPRIPLRLVRESIERFDPKKDPREIDVYMMRGAHLGSLADLTGICENAGDVLLGGAGGGGGAPAHEIEIGIFFMRLNAGLVKPHMNYNPNVLEEMRRNESAVHADAMVSGAGLPDVA